MRLGYLSAVQRKQENFFEGYQQNRKAGQADGRNAASAFWQGRRGKEPDFFHGAEMGAVLLRTVTMVAREKTPTRSTGAW
ncbi:hypothetical protein GU926_06835 [Nibribacter ruber]|uniref:Uncharacterized protein n=1 Tax=Nibribacter ruber TaxID=2698458 RepID=A0A6P1NVS4_9BACT|nr:hypothetical protein [Nibribacter ruber]QHL87160.1 hypothetical protein GU926_06835 [Nibribacter ruber]